MYGSFHTLTFCVACGCVCVRGRGVHFFVFVLDRYAEQNVFAASSVDIIRNARIVFVSETGNLNDQLSFSMVLGSGTDTEITFKCIVTLPVPAENPDDLIRHSHASCHVLLVHRHFAGARFHYSVLKFLGSVF